MPNHSKFIPTLYKILETPEYSEVISWSDNGSAFIISDIKNLTKILKLHFKDVQIKSFFRQLQLYQFETTKTCLNIKKYKHQEFYKGMNQLMKIKRVISKNHDYHRENKQLMIQLQSLRNQQTDLLDKLKVTMETQQKLSKFILELKKIYYLRAIDRIKSAHEFKFRSSAKRRLLEGLFKLFLNHTEKFHTQLDFPDLFELLELNEEIYTPIIQLKS